MLSAEKTTFNKSKDYNSALLETRLKQKMTFQQQKDISTVINNP